MTAADLNSAFTDVTTVTTNHEGRLTVLEEGRARVSIADLSPGFTIPTATFVTVPYATKSFDDRGEFDPATHAFKAKTAGDYLVCSSLALPTGVQALEIDLFVNGVRDRALSGAQPGSSVGGCRLVRLAANDVLDVRAYMAYGAAIQVGSDPSWDWLTISEQR